MSRLSAFRAEPPSRRRQALAMRWRRLWTELVYRRQLAKCGKGSLVMRPLFWTPEFISLGERALIWRDARIEGITRHGDQTFAPEVVIGDRVSIQSRVHIVAASKIEIGSDTTISLDVTILDSDHSHALPGVNVMLQPLVVSAVHIGKDCFIGAGARILSGTRLGDGVIVGANAVVRGVYPSYCVIAGVPARIIKRFDIEAGQWVTASPSER